jgi:hypothetical protein
VPSAAAHRRTAAVAGSHSAGRTPGKIAVAAIAAVELLALLAAALVPRTEAAGAAAGLPNCELGDGPRRRLLPFGPRERCANQRPMDRAVFFNRAAIRGSVVRWRVVGRMIAVRRLRVRRFVAVVADLDILPHDSFFSFFFSAFYALFYILFFSVFFSVCIMQMFAGRLVSDALGTIRGDLRVQRRRRVRFAALPRHFRVLVFVLRVARGAARLLDVVTNHRDHGVVRHASLARTVIVQNVTKPKLALLHLRSRELDHWRGM